MAWPKGKQKITFFKFKFWSQLAIFFTNFKALNNGIQDVG
jgi:hypothetical protein